MKKLVWSVLLCLFAIPLHAAPDLTKVSMHYDDTNNRTVIYAQEKLVDANTGLGASYNYSGHVLQSPPNTVSLSLFGYHGDALWQKLQTLTLTYGGKTYTHKVIVVLYGEDRDKSEDLVDAKFYEPMVMSMPLSVARDVFNSDTVIVTSNPDSINLSLTPEQMDRCRDLLASIPSVLTIRPPDLKKSSPSADGLPVTRTINEASGNVTLATTGTTLSSRFSMQYLAFVTISGKQLRQPPTALLVAEVADEPFLEKESNITLNYGDTHLDLSSIRNPTEASEAGIKMTARTYVISYRRLLAIGRAKSFSLTIGNITVPVPSAKMAGIREIVRRIQH